MGSSATEQIEEITRRLVAEFAPETIILFRYPDEVLEPEKEEFETAQEAAVGLVAFVLSVLPEEVRPGEDAPETHD